MSTKHEIADIHTKAITKSDVWSHLSKLAQLFPHVAQAGTSLRRANSLCIRPRSSRTMSQSGFTVLENFYPSQEDVVFRCSKCNHLEADADKLKKRFQIGTSITLCCSVCDELHEVVVIVSPKSDVDTSMSTPASPLMESSAATSVTPLSLKAAILCLLKPRTLLTML